VNNEFQVSENVYDNEEEDNFHIFHSEGQDNDYVDKGEEPEIEKNPNTHKIKIQKLLMMRTMQKNKLFSTPK
jgi:hypothetical protein